MNFKQHINDMKNLYLGPKAGKTRKNEEDELQLTSPKNSKMASGETFRWRRSSRRPA